MKVRGWSGIPESSSSSTPLRSVAKPFVEYFRPFRYFHLIIELGNLISGQTIRIINSKRCICLLIRIIISSDTSDGVIMINYNG